MVFIHIDQGLGNDRIVKTTLLVEFSKAAGKDGDVWTDVTLGTGEKTQLCLKYDEMARIVEESQKTGQIPNLICENMRNVYDAVREGKDFSRVFTKPKIIQF